ncbi:MAG: hypothetical protein Q9162_007325 [Coniocarpon cinnabarinum]
MSDLVSPWPPDLVIEARGCGFHSSPPSKSKGKEVKHYTVILRGKNLYKLAVYHLYTEDARAEGAVIEAYAFDDIDNSGAGNKTSEEAHAQDCLEQAQSFFLGSSGQIFLGHDRVGTVAVPEVKPEIHKLGELKQRVANGKSLGP